MRNCWLLVFLIALVQCTPQSSNKTASSDRWPGITPDSVRPSPRQITYHKKERIAFIHFGPNTFTNREWGNGEEKASMFNPTSLDADQWVKVLSETGFETIILTAKHHDGFCLWPSKYTKFDVASSPWKNGNGDVVKAVAEACQKYGVDFGVYLSPWDMHEPTYGTPEYNEFYKNQLKELLTNYGPIAEIWFDGAKGENAEDMKYHFKEWWAMVRKLQPNAVIFSDEGPDVHWVGNENGIGGKTSWSKMDTSKVGIGKAGQGAYLQKGDPHGGTWVVAECDVSIRPGWFYHSDEDDEVKTVAQLVDLYKKSVGRNCTLLLNVPPMPSGKLNPVDVKRLYAFADSLKNLFDNNLALQQTVQTQSVTERYPASNLTDGKWDEFWISAKGDTTATLTLTLSEAQTFDHIVLQEFIPIGQRIASFSVEAKTDQGWQQIAQGTTVGYKRILTTNNPITTQKVQLTIDKSYGRPALTKIALYNSQK